MFRFNNPDALLVLLLTAAAYATTRAVEKAETRWVLAVGALVGAAFLAKMLQAFLVVPGFGFAYLLAAPTSLRRRITQLLAALAAMVVAGGWWVAIVELWPAGSRPFIGGSQNNSLLNLIFGYNGLGRLSGNESGSVGGGGGGGNTGGRWGATGLGRLFNTSFGGQASWLLPTALVSLVAVVAFAGRARRTDRSRAAIAIWGGWLLVTGLAFSLGQGIIHEYYTVALAPAIGALVGIGATTMWARRHQRSGRLLMAATTALTTWWAYTLLERTPSWHPWVATTVVVAGVAATAAFLAQPLLPSRRSVWTTIGAVTLVAGLLGPAAYSVATAATAHAGSLPTAGPATSRLGGPGGQGGPGGPGGFGGQAGGQGRAGGQGNFPTGNGGPPAANGTTGTGTGAGTGPGTGTAGAGTNTTGGPTAGGIGGILNGSTPSAELTDTLSAGSGSYTWVAAVVSANQAAGYQLATGEPVMAIGGFNGTDPSPTLAQFEALVAQQKIHFFIAGGGGGAQSSGSGSTIAQWVAANFKATTVGNVTLYDLTT
jgi:4-amino-4-deoxy-L-arabinose transferase-like glycosyltransferase